MSRFLKLLISGALVAWWTIASAQPLLTPTEVVRRSSDPLVRIIDIRPSAIYDKGHIAAAQSAPYEKWRGPSENPGRLPDASTLTALIRSLGIDRETPVVVIYEGTDATDFGAAARVVWTLKASGLGQLSILNGGMTAWRAAGLPVTTAPVSVGPSTYTARLDPTVIATQQQVADVVGVSKARLIDARPSEYFRGETRHPAAHSPGTLAGAKNVEPDVWFADSAAMLSADEIRRVAAREGVDAEQPTISFCNTGHWAATQWFVLSEVLGQKSVRLYPESMVGWSNAGLPMTNVPSRLQQFWLQLKEAAGAL